jgi:hypothetical protein
VKVAYEDMIDFRKSYSALPELQLGTFTTVY